MSDMLTKAEALEIVSRKLQEMNPTDDLFVVVDEHTIEKSFGWVFFYNSKKFVETGIFEDRLAGNGPVIVNKFSGDVEFHGSAKSPEEIIEEYLRKSQG